MKSIRLTAAQAMVRFLSAQKVEVDDRRQRLFEGVSAIFGHGDVAGLGEALYAEREELPTYRAHNDQAMAHAAIAFAAPGDGMIDYVAVFKALRGYSGWVVLEAEGEGAGSALREEGRGAYSRRAQGGGIGVISPLPLGEGRG